MITRLRQALGSALSALEPPPELKHPLPVALTAAGLATLMRFALDPVLHDHSPFLFFEIAVVIAALYGGAWAGIGVILLTIPLCDYLLIEPRYTWFIHDASADSIMLALFALLGSLTTLIIHRFQQNKRRLKQSLIDLQRSELKLEMTAATIPEVIFSARETGAVEYLNGYLPKYCGQKLHDLVGSGWLDFVHPDDRGAVAGRFSRYPEPGNEFETVVRLRRADGVYRMFKCHARRMLDPEEKANKWFGVFSDINNEQELTAALESRTQELIRINEALERFAYTASHDLQEPLRTIGGMTELLLRRAGYTLDSQSSEMLALVVKAVSRMERLIRDLMDLAKATDASTQPTSDVDMRAVAEMAIANLGQAIRESGARIILEELPLVHANETAMVRLVQNLIANAIKYRTDTPPVIHISASRRKQDSTFSIRDNGIGIAPEYTQKIFEPFQRLHGRADYEGSGLGLAACRRIVEALNGTIWVESKGGEGSTFFFTIPQEANPDQKAPAREGDAANLNRVQQSPPRNAQRAAHGGLH